MKADMVKMLRFAAARDYAERIHLPAPVEFAIECVKSPSEAFRDVAIEYLAEIWARGGRNGNVSAEGLRAGAVWATEPEGAIV